MRMSHFVTASTIFAAALTFLTPARADPVADFYKGQTISVIVGYPPGGGYDLLSRMLARHIGKFIPREPRLIVQNMPGAGSRTAAAHVYNVAPQDGSVIGIVSQYLPLAHLLSEDRSFESSKFHWIGSLGQGGNNVMLAWRQTGVKSVEDLKSKSLIVASAGPQTNTEYYVATLNNMFGTRIKSVPGYRGTGDVQLAIERGELEGMASVDWPGLKRARGEWLKDGKINIFLQVGLQREPELPDVPLMTDLARNPQERQVLEMISAGVDIGRPYFVGPKVPADRVASLRAAFDKMREAPDFLADIQKGGLVINPISGHELQKLVESSTMAPLDIIERTRAALDTKGLGR